MESWSGKRTIAHIDMDAFYAAIEVLDDPSLAGRPVIVGGDERRGVVSSASYEARAFGVGSAMPIFQARRLCPGGVFVRRRMRRYAEISRLVMKCLEEFSPLVEQISIDEAFVDLAGTEAIHGGPLDAAKAIKSLIREKTSLSCSVGVSFTKLLAKIASDIAKPDGLTIVAPNEERAFLEKLPIQKVPGIGKKGCEELDKLKVRFVGDLMHFDPERLAERFGKFGQWLCDVAKGGSEEPVEPYTEPKSVSAEATLDEDTDDARKILASLRRESDRVARRLRREGFLGSTVTLKLKTADFKTFTRSITLREPTQLGETIFCEARKLLESNWKRCKVRLVGVAVSNLEHAQGDIQFELFAARDPKLDRLDRLERAADEIADRFGENALKRASTVEEE